jgi:hypothetical protein
MDSFYILGGWSRSMVNIILAWRSIALICSELVEKFLSVRVGQIKWSTGRRSGRLY